MNLSAKWTPDCSGKWDYDGVILEISTRYYPRGGGFHVSDGKGDLRPSAEKFPDVKPSATSKIEIVHGDDDYALLIQQEFTGDTEAEVKGAVEKWAAEKFERIVAVLQREFGELRSTPRCGAKMEDGERCERPDGHSGPHRDLPD